jgi:hypothetical protein
VPEISRFLGIIIAIYYRDHGPPHFHAVYGEFEVTVTIDGAVVSGEFPKRALRLVLEWHELHRRELALNWDRAKRREPLVPVAPLE